MRLRHMGFVALAAAMAAAATQGGMWASAAPHTRGTTATQQVANTQQVAKTDSAEFPRPGPLNAITDVDGILVGQYTRTDNPYQTGTTVVYAPDGAVNGVSVPGGWPGGVNDAMLDPHKNPQLSDAIFLSGGSFYGLSAYGGVMRWLEEHCHGLQVGSQPCQVDPLVSGAIVFDLFSGKSFKARPTAEFGYRAIDNAEDGPVAQGDVGAGTGTHSRPFKAGVGTASVEYANGLKVGALIVVNAGTAVNPKDCSLYARYLGLDDEFKGLKLPTKHACRKAFDDDAAEESKQHAHTAIAVVATNAKLSDVATDQMASRGGDGEVIGIDTIHTSGDGDTVYGLSTGKWDHPCNDRDCVEQVNEGATKTIGRAIVHAMLNATSTDDSPSYCDTFRRACKHLVKK